MRRQIAKMIWDDCEPDVPEERAHRILTFIREEIEKGLLSDEKIGDMWETWAGIDCPSFEEAKILAVTRLKTVAQAQLQKTLKALEV